ncbi:MAG TPA: DUF3080 family protein [Motiliproteus sp.]
MQILRVLLGALYLAAPSLTLVGCSIPSPQGVLQEYLERVANVLEQPLPSASASTPAISLPARRERQLAINELRAGVLDALDLADCGLLPLISERNSILGKVKRPSAVMVYEYKFFGLLQRCYLQDQQKPIHDEEFSRRLSEIYQTKRANLPAVVWNALLASSEMEANLSLTHPPLALEGNPGFGASLRALQGLQQYRHSLQHLPSQRAFQPPADMDNLEQHYFALYASEYGSQLFTSLRLLTQQLNQTAAVIERKLAQRPLCPSGRPVAKANHLKGVFDRYYATQLLPYMARVQREGLLWLKQMEQLSLPLPTQTTDPLDRYRRRMLSTTDPDSIWQHYQRAISRHTRSWQQILDQCGLMPGSDA